MSTWLLDTPLFNMLATPKAKPLHEWCEAIKPSLFISATATNGRRASSCNARKGFTVDDI